MRIAQPIRPDFGPCALRLDERIVVGNAIAAVLADKARAYVLVQVGNDPQNLADEVIEPLRIVADGNDARLTRRAVADFRVEHAPLRITRTRSWIKDDLALRVTMRIQSRPQNFARGAFEGGVLRVRVGPFEDHPLADARTRYRNGL